jgi:hypothetical protein
MRVCIVSFLAMVASASSSYASSTGIRVICEEGHFCPNGSTNSRERACGGNEVYCPAGSTTPMVAEAGKYTIGGSSFLHRTSALLCEPGHYCQSGVKKPCPGGR